MFQYFGQSTPPPPYSPSAITTIEGINFDENESISGFYSIPPDPIGAAGPSHLVSVVNTSIEWFTKTGTKQNSQRLGKNSTTHMGSFFESLTPATGTFDPKVIYDQYNGRFVVITLEQTSNNPRTSRILIAVSKTSDPNNGWWFAAINSRITVGVKDSWADYPGLAVGTDAIYITANMFGFVGQQPYTGGRLWIVAKTSFYSGGIASVTVHDHITDGGGYGGTYQPAHMFGTPPTSVGTFLLLYSGLSDGTNESVNVIRVDNPLTSTTFTGQDILLGNVDNTGGPYNNAPQLGTTTTIATNDRRSQNAVWRNNSLWSAFTVVPPSGVDLGEVTAHWVKISTSTLSALTLLDQGDIGGEDIATDCYTFFPSIAVNSSNDVAIGFSASASTIYPGCYYTGRLSTDAAGFTITPDVIKAGLDYYIRLFSGSRNRWGDYSGTSVDPSDDQTFYVFNEYALTRGTVIDPPYPGQDGRWGTAFGVVPISALPVELSSFTAKVLRNSGVQLNWTTETEVNNYGFEVERKNPPLNPLQGGDFEMVGFVEGHGNSNSPKEYNYLDEGISYGSYAYRLKQIDNDGTFEYSKIIKIDIDAPLEFELSQNYPNPFNPSTTIKYSLPVTSNVKLSVFNILGEEVQILVNETEEAGIYTINFNASQLNSGIYFYKLETRNFLRVKKMSLIR
jgi:hypothetical protein